MVCYLTYTCCCFKTSPSRRTRDAALRDSYAAVPRARPYGGSLAFIAAHRATAPLVVAPNPDLRTAPVRNHVTTDSLLPHTLATQDSSQCSSHCGAQACAHPKAVHRLQVRARCEFSSEGAVVCAFCSSVQGRRCSSSCHPPCGAHPGTLWCTPDHSLLGSFAARRHAAAPHGCEIHWATRTTVQARACS